MKRGILIIVLILLMSSIVSAGFLDFLTGKQISQKGEEFTLFVGETKLITDVTGKERKLTLLEVGEYPPGNVVIDIDGSSGNIQLAQMEKAPINEQIVGEGLAPNSYGQIPILPAGVINGVGIKVMELKYQDPTKYGATLKLLSEGDIVRCKETDEGDNPFWKGEVNIGQYRSSASKGIIDSNLPDICLEENKLVEYNLYQKECKIDKIIYDCSSFAIENRVGICDGGMCVIKAVKEEIKEGGICDRGLYRCEKDLSTGNYTGWAQKCYPEQGWVNVIYCESGCSGISGQCVSDEEKTVVEIEKEKTTSVLSPSDPVKIIPTQVCNGCLTGDICIPFSIKQKGQYCDISKQFLSQKELGQSCENSYECKSNECSNGECISTAGLLQRILDILSKFFGGK